MILTPCDILRDRLSELFVCQAAGPRTRVRTPFLYPDGDVVDLYVKTADGAGTVSDLGESAAWLRMQTISLRRSPKQNALIEDVCQTLGVELFRGCLMKRFNNEIALVEAIQRVGQAAVRVADLWFTFRTRAIESINDEVADFFTERQVRFSRGDKMTGRSGSTWTVDFHTRTDERSSMVLVASTGNRSAARRIAEHVLAAWIDLNRWTVGPEGLQPITLVDDSVDMWSTVELGLMEQGSTLARWSAPDEFADLLKRPAAA